MNFIIRKIAQWIARRLESGNARAGLIGALAGAATGAGAAYALYHTDVLGAFRYAAFVLLPLVGAFLGALVGSALPGHPTVRADRPVRINNLNRGLVPLFGFCVFAAAAALIPFVRAKEDKSFTRNVALGAGALALLSLAFGSRAVLFVDVGDEGVALRRLIGRRVYPLGRVKRWGFEIARGKLVREPPRVVVPFLITFDDGSSFESPGVQPATAAALAAKLSAPPPASVLHERAARMRLA